MKNWQLSKLNFLKQKYKYMRQRVYNISNRYKWGTSPVYKNIRLCSKEAFLEFALKNKRFDTLFAAYKRSHGKLLKAPSVDRIDPKKGYVVGNMQFLSFSDNAKKGIKDRKVVLISTKTGKYHRFMTNLDAGRWLGHSGRIKPSRKYVQSVKTGERFYNTSFNRFKNARS